MIRNLMKAALLSTALLTAAGSAMAADNIVWWDFLGGGDGVRMKALIDQFNKENTDLQIQATTLEWGTPFYTKVQTSAAIGEGPDIMTYHESRMPLGVSDAMKVMPLSATSEECMTLSSSAGSDDTPNSLNVVSSSWPPNTVR